MSAGKGDWIPGTNDAAYSENYPTIDWNARERERHLQGPRGRKPSDLTFGEPRELDMRPIAGDEPVDYPLPGTPIWSKP